MRTQAGFTLIEAMIVVVIMGLLTLVAYPSYQDYIKKSRRSDAQQLMMDIHTRQKQIIIEQRAYAQAIGATNVAASGWTCSASTVIPGTCTNGYYSITFNPAVDNTATPPSYSICATPTNAQQTSDGTLILTHAGTRTRMVGATACAGGTDKGW